MERILITANTPGDVSLSHMGRTLHTEYQKHGYEVVGILETQMERAAENPFIVLNRVGVMPFGMEIAQKNLRLVSSWTAMPDKFVTYYIDDLLVHMNDNLPQEFMKRCENVVVSNYVLKDYMENKCWIPECRIVRTHVNYDAVDAQPVYEVNYVKDGQFGILWGSIGRLGLDFLSKVCEKLNKHPKARDISLITIGMNCIHNREELAKYRNLRIHYREAVDINGFWGIGKQAHMMVNPVSTDALQHFTTDPEQQKIWLASKCEPKFALAGALRIPLISGNMRAYTEAITDGKDGFLSDDPDEWYEIIIELMGNDSLREYIGKNARHQAETTYCYKKRALEYIAAFTQREDDE